MNEKKILEIISKSIWKSNEKLLQITDKKFIDIVNDSSQLKFIKK